jgi:hypothetical protein
VERGLGGVELGGLEQRGQEQQSGEEQGQEGGAERAQIPGSWGQCVNSSRSEPAASRRR